MPPHTLTLPRPPHIHHLGDSCLTWVGPRSHWERKGWKSWGVVLCLQLVCNDGKGGWEERDAEGVGKCQHQRRSPLTKHDTCTNKDVITHCITASSASSHPHPPQVCTPPLLTLHGTEGCTHASHLPFSHHSVHHNWLAPRSRRRTT